MNKLVLNDTLLSDLIIRSLSLLLRVKENEKVLTSISIKNNLKKNVKLSDSLTLTLNSIVERTKNLTIYIQSNSISVIFN